MSSSLVSVIVPIYNTEQYLHRCIDSIRNQTYKNLEIILVDDGSPDGSAQICNDYALKDPRIKVIHKANGGLSSARNAGIAAASGEFISFIDSDDYIKPEMYQKMVHAAEKNEAEICMCRGITLDEHGQFGAASVSEGVQAQSLTGEEMLNRLVKDGAPKYVVVWNKLFARRLFETVRFAEGKQHEDEYIAHHLYGLSSRTVMIDDVLYVYQLRGGSIMHTAVSVKRLDVVDALLDRVQFFLNQKKQQLAAYSFYQAVISYVDITSQIVNQDAYVKERIDTLKKSLHNAYSEISLRELPAADRIKLILKLYFKTPYAAVKRVQTALYSKLR